MRQQPFPPEYLTQGKYLTPFQRELLQKSLSQELSKPYQQRLQIMLLADAGKTQREISQLTGCAPATVRNWVLIARVGMAHKWQEIPLGRPKKVTAEFLERLRELVTQNPQDYGYAFRRWTASWLRKHLAKELGIEVHQRHIIRLLKDMGLSTHCQEQMEAIEDFYGEASEAQISIQDISNLQLSDVFLLTNNIK
jgi:transposase